MIEAGGADSLFGFTHDDVLRTRTPAVAPAIMDGGGNDDTIYGSEAADNIRGGERLSGRDTLYGAGGNDRILGDGNDDKLYGQLGDDELFGGDGFDFLDGGPGDDTCDGGELDDKARDCERRSSIEQRPVASWRYSGSDLRVAVRSGPVAGRSGQRASALRSGGRRAPRSAPRRDRSGAGRSGAS